MNEKIKELIEQAEVWNTNGDVDKCEVDLEKFAELIIKECINNIHLHTFVFDPPISRGMKTAIRLTKEHFGIKDE